MRRALLQRERAGDQGTLGALVAPGLALVTMEPPWRDNRRNRSCIPAGAYEVLPHISPRFGRCLTVAAVHRRSHILFHAGNLGGDTEQGWHTHTAGCVLPGLRRGRITARGRAQAAVAGLAHRLSALDGMGRRPALRSGDQRCLRRFSISAPPFSRAALLAC